MSKTIKQKWLDFAEATDAMRIMPRLLVAAYGVFSIWYIRWIVEWFMILPAPERTAEVAAFVTGTITAVLGGNTWFMSAYTKSGRDWSATKVDKG